MRKRYVCGLCSVGEHCHGDSNNAECECYTCEMEGVDDASQ